MNHSRRRLLGVVPAVFAAAAFPELAISAEAWDTPELPRGKFQSLINASFRVEFKAGGSRWFTLLSVGETPLKSPIYRSYPVMPRHLKIPLSPVTESFILEFQSLGEALSQGTYVFQHPSLGRTPLFIVPSGNSTYTATINRLVKNLSGSL